MQAAQVLVCSNVTLAGEIPFVTQNLAAEQLGVAAWGREMLAAGIFQVGFSIAQKKNKKTLWECFPKPGTPRVCAEW